jgi:acetyltransferase-like isoleucine patch superfamily enzyme
MRKTIRNAYEKLARDFRKGRHPRELLHKGTRYAWELASARMFLGDVDELGIGVRTLGRPRIENFGFMSIGAHAVLRNVNVPIELVTEHGANLVIGADCSINYGVSIGATLNIRIGQRCRIGPYVMIIDSAFHQLLDRDTRPPSQPVVLEDDVWVGAKANIMPGITVGRGAVIGTAAVVTKDVPPFTVVAGVPAKIIQRLDESQFVKSAVVAAV